MDRTYGALSDSTRRAILIALQHGEARVRDLAEPFPISLAAVSRHIGVLHAAGLVQREVRGREHWMSVRPEPLHDAEQWIAGQLRLWEQRADSLAALFEGPHRPPVTGEPAAVVRRCHCGVAAGRLRAVGRGLTPGTHDASRPSALDRQFSAVRGRCRTRLR